MAANMNPRPSWTSPNCDWIVHQVIAHALPALIAELRQLNRWKNKTETLLDEKTLNAEQRAELTFILDSLARRGLIFNGAEDGHTWGKPYVKLSEKSADSAETPGDPGERT